MWYLVVYTAVKNEAALSYHRVRGLCFLAVVFTVTIIVNINGYANVLPILLVKMFGHRNVNFNQILFSL